MSSEEKSKHNFPKVLSIITIVSFFFKKIYLLKKLYIFAM